VHDCGTLRCSETLHVFFMFTISTGFDERLSMSTHSLDISLHACNFWYKRTVLNLYILQTIVRLVLKFPYEHVLELPCCCSWRRAFLCAAATEARMLHLTPDGRAINPLVARPSSKNWSKHTVKAPVCRSAPLHAMAARFPFECKPLLSSVCFVWMQRVLHTATHAGVGQKLLRLWRLTTLSPWCMLA
jgi:hypothetical protein